MKSLKQTLFILSLVTLVFIPIDGLAVSILPVSSNSSRVLAPVQSDGEMLETLAVYKQTFQSSRAFGELSGSENISTQLLIDKILAAIQVKGVVQIGSAEAILEDKASRKTVFVKIGETFQGLLVQNIGADSVTFSDGDSQKTLEIANS